MTSVNCKDNFWLLSNNGTVLIGNCPTISTIPAPIIRAITVCNRSIENNILEKCSIDTQQTIPPDIHKFSFIQNSIYAGILYTVTAQSQTACLEVCSSNNMLIKEFYLTM